MALKDYKFLKKEKPLVSIVIAARNEEAYIEECLSSISGQTYPKETIEVVIADGRSSDKTREKIHQFKNILPNLIVVENAKLLPQYGFNLAIQKSKGDLVMFFGAHATLPPHYIEKAIAVLKQGKYDTVGGRLINAAKTKKGKAIAALLGSPFGVGNAYFRFSPRDQEVDTVAFAMYPREIFDFIPGFEPDLTASHDLVFNYQLKALGGRVFLSSELWSVYYVRETFAGLWRQYFSYGLSKKTAFEKAKGFMSWRQLIPPLFVLTSPLTIFIYIPVALLASICIAFRKRVNFFFVALAAFIVHYSFGLGFIVGWLKPILFRVNKK